MSFVQKRRRFLIVVTALLLICSAVIATYCLVATRSANHKLQIALKNASAAGILLAPQPQPLAETKTVPYFKTAFGCYTKAAEEAANVSGRNITGKIINFASMEEIPMPTRLKLDQQCKIVDQFVQSGNLIRPVQLASKSGLAARQAFVTLTSVQYAADVISFQISTEAKAGNFSAAASNLVTLFELAGNIGSESDYTQQEFESAISRLGLQKALLCLNYTKLNPSALKLILVALSHYNEPPIQKYCINSWLNNKSVFDHVTPIREFIPSRRDFEDITPWQENFRWIRAQWATNYLEGLTHVRQCLAQGPSKWQNDYRAIQTFCYEGIRSTDGEVVLRQQLTSNLLNLFTSETKTESVFRLTVALALQLAKVANVTPPKTLLDPNLAIDPISGGTIQVIKNDLGYASQSDSRSYRTSGPSGPITGRMTLQWYKNPPPDLEQAVSSQLPDAGRANIATVN